MERLLLMLALALLITSCASQKQSQSKPNQIAFQACPEQRPQVCTREYRPVCATRDTGVRCVATPCPASEQKTYGNACDACADKKVLGYIVDACTQTSPVK